MKTTIARFLSALAGVTALSCIGLALWYVFGDLPNPLPPQVAVLPGLEFVGHALRWLLGLASYLIAGAALILIFQAVSRIVLVGWDRFIAEEKIMDKNPLDGLETPPISEATKQAIARADAVMAEANLPTYTDLLEGLNKLWRRTGRPGPISVAWFHEHITPLMPK